MDAMGDMDGDAQHRKGDAKIRSNFSALALWVGSAITDVNGETTINYKVLFA